MERQLVFPFETEDMKMNGKTCVTCEHQEKCVESGETISIEHTCGSWKESTETMQSEDSIEFFGEYVILMERYGIPKEDAKRIYDLANLF